MKRFTVETMYSGDAIVFTVCATKASDAKRHIELFFKGCQVLKVKQIKNETPEKQIQRMAA